MKSLYLLAALIGLSACAVQAQSGKSAATPTWNADSIATWYQASIADALDPTPQEICDTLWGINPTNAALEYKRIEDTLYVKAANLLNDSSFIKYYQKYLGVDSGAYQFGGSYRLWVSLVPEAQQACSSPSFLEEFPLRLRTQMLFGLPPVPIKQAGDEYVVMELWVKVADLDRPAADPDPFSNVAGLDMPGYVTPEYRSWFNYTRAYQYTTGGTGYPWTQLGYTYDWSPNNTHHVGMSEYVLKPGSRIFLIGKTTLSQYCQEP